MYFSIIWLSIFTDIMMILVKVKQKNIFVRKVTDILFFQDMAEL